MASWLKNWRTYVGVAAVVGGVVVWSDVRFRDVPLPTDDAAIGQIAAALGEEEGAAFRRYMLEYRQQTVVDAPRALEQFGGRKVRDAVKAGRARLKLAPTDVHDELVPLPGADSETKRIMAALSNDEGFAFRVFVDSYHLAFAFEEASEMRKARRLTVREAIALGKEMQEEVLSQQPDSVRQAVRQWQAERRETGDPPGDPGSARD